MPLGAHPAQGRGSGRANAGVFVLEQPSEHRNGRPTDACQDRSGVPANFLVRVPEQFQEGWNGRLRLGAHPFQGPGGILANVFFFVLEQFHEGRNGRLCLGTDPLQR